MIFEEDYPVGMCWFVGRCSWWNPPKDLMWELIEKGINPCIKCWKFMKTYCNLPEKAHTVEWDKILNSLKVKV